MLVHVRTPVGKGLHCCWMIVDDDTVLILGREMLGYSKKIGIFEFEENGDEIRSAVSRRGNRVLEIRARRGETQDLRLQCSTTKPSIREPWVSYWR